MSLLPVLQTLDDIPALEGSFVIGTDGKILGSSLAQTYSEDTLKAVARRVRAILSAHGSLLGGASEIFLRFSLKSLYARHFSGALLVAFCDARVNRGSLRVAANLIGEELSTLLTQAAEISAPPPARPPSSLIKTEPQTVEIPAPAARPKPTPSKPATRTGIWG